MNLVSVPLFASDHVWVRVKHIDYLVRFLFSIKMISLALSKIFVMNFVFVSAVGRSLI